MRCVPTAERIATLAPLSVAFVASAGPHSAGLVRRSGRAWVIGGLAAPALVVMGFIVLLNLAG